MSNQASIRPVKAQSSQKSSGLPVPVISARPRPSLKTYAVPAHFLTQLLAEREKLATQRPRRRVSVPRANRAYQSGVQIAAARLPTGFVHSKVA